MMLFGIRRLAAAQASARMLPRSLRTHATRRVRREVALTAGADQRNCSVLMRVRPTSPSAFCLADSSCSGLVSISAAFSMSTGLFTRFCMRARPGADSSCAARETRHQSGRPAWAGALRGRGQVAGVRLSKTMACIWSGQERTGQAVKGRRHGTSVLHLLNLAASATQTYAE